MKEEAVVAEVRRVRQEHAAAFGYDLDRIVQDIRMRENQDRSLVVRLPPKRPRVKRP